MNPVTFYKNLADDTRLKSLLLLLHEGELCVCELTAALDLSQPKVSRNLAQLRQYSLLVDRKQGKWVFYQLNPDLPQWCQKVIEKTAQSNVDYIAEDIARLRNMGDRPERAASCC